MHGEGMQADQIIIIIKYYWLIMLSLLSAKTAALSIMQSSN